jgi:hypothetical protein
VISVSLSDLSWSQVLRYFGASMFLKLFFDLSESPKEQYVRLRCGCDVVVMTSLSMMCHEKVESHV